MRHLLILIGFCAMSFSYGHSIQEPAKPEILHVYEGHTEYVPVSTCKPLGKLKTATYRGHEVEMAAAIPVTALGRNR